MDNSDIVSELIVMDAVFSNFHQIHENCDKSREIGLNFEKYTSQNSLLYYAETAETVEYRDSLPHYFIKYRLIVTIGGSKNPETQTGMTSSPPDTNFYFDFFKENNADSVDSIENIKHLMHDSMKFLAMPLHSIVFVDKVYRKIDYDNESDYKQLKEYLKEEIQKINYILTSIKMADEKIREFIKKIETEKRRNQDKLDTLLSTRGGSFDKYCEMFMKIMK